MPPAVQEETAAEGAIGAAFDLGKHFQAVGSPLTAVNGEDFNWFGLTGKI
jgi:hypothetical protein